MRRKRRLWSYATGGKGSTVTVYERTAGGMLYAKVYDPSLAGGRGGHRKRSLGHCDKAAAEVYALEQAAKLKTGLAELQQQRRTLAALFATYVTHHTPKKSANQQVNDQRRVKVWTRWLGAGKDPHRITRRDWEDFIEARVMGAIAADGQPVAAEKRRTVRARTVEVDLAWLKAVLNWGTTWEDREGHRLLRENPVRGFEVPTERNPRRPIATDDRYEATRAKSDQVLMEIRWDGHRRAQRSYLSELLDLANGTARRISAICQLRYQDLRLAATPDAPHGAIRWPEDTDKEGKAWEAPINAAVRAALDRVLRERPGIGPAYLFPSPKNPAEPVGKDLAREWLLGAERLAELPKLKGGAWHPYRRKWATARKHLSLKDVAAAGGWRCTETLLRCYQQADQRTMLDVVLGGAELRERKA